MLQERDQHDVQELNRILFSAIEDSLDYTSGKSVIRDLYHGTIVNMVNYLCLPVKLLPMRYLFRAKPLFWLFVLSSS